MRYLELVFNVSGLDISDKEMLIAQLYNLGCDSFEEKEHTLNAFIPSKYFDLISFKKSISMIKGGEGLLDIKKLEEKNWNSIWESSFQPIFIGSDCCVRAPFHSRYKDYKIDIIISPKMSFGTGHHPTTFLMIKQLLSFNLKDKTVLDVGAGTGVLSILSEKIGASMINSIDIDHYSYLNSLENISLNNCNNISVFETNISDFKKNENFDFILANINKNVLISEISEYIYHLSNQGFLILSGFFESDFEIINNCVLKSNLQLYLKEVKKEWLCLVYVK